MLRFREPPALANVLSVIGKTRGEITLRIQRSSALGKEQTLEKWRIISVSGSSPIPRKERSTGVSVVRLIGDSVEKLVLSP
jgi:hypothetical protein